MQHNTRTAIYCRLSVKNEIDRLSGDVSDSIEGQRLLLEKYAEDNGLLVVGTYVDDGYSGTKFDNRPDFVRMLEDIDKQRVNAVLIKDLSRLGRNYIEVGRYQEIIFPEKGVRLIAPSDGYDSERGMDDMSPIRNMFNDFFARDTSRKVRKAIEIRAQAGKYVGSGMYGYKRAETDRHKLVVDEDIAPIVRRIFDMAASGYGPNKISKVLQAEGIPTPAEVKGIRPRDGYLSGYIWNSTSIMGILRNPNYLGHLTQLRYTIQSYRVNKILHNPADKWAVVENAHEPIVDQATWDTAHAVLATRKKPSKTGEPHIFAGLLRCATCGAPLSKNGEAMTCKVYKLQGREFCTSHYITMKNITAVVLDSIQAIARRVKGDKAGFVSELSGISAAQSKQHCVTLTKERTQKQKRLEKLATLIRKVFEQNIDGILPDEAYRQMLNDYNAEQAILQEQLAEADARIAELKQGADNAADFVELIEKYCDITELDGSITHELVERIVVHQAQTIDGEKHQEIDIHFRFAGKIN
jgi:DNA invertase Pin-like site-specific DNA recombinase